MGTSLCCSKEVYYNSYISPQNQRHLLFHHKPNLDDNTVLRLKRNENQQYSIMGIQNKLLSSQQKSKQQNVQKLAQQSEIAFAISLTYNIKFISYSQRRFIGFRNRYEFDKKRLLIASNSELTVVGYDQLERPFELYRGSLLPQISNFHQDIPISIQEKEQVLLVQFLEEHIPSFILVVSQCKKEKRVDYRILKLKKSKRVLEQSNVSVRDKSLLETSTKEFLQEHLKDHIQKGNFTTTRKRRDMDNIEMVPKSNVKLFRITKCAPKDENFDMLMFDGSMSNNDGESTYQVRSAKNSMALDTTNKSFSNLMHQGTSFKFQKHIKKKSRTERQSFNQNEDENNFFLTDTQPYCLDEFGKLTISGQITNAYLFHSYNGNFLYTFDELPSSAISIYVIKACSKANSKNIELQPNKSPKISNFRMAKRCSVNLDYIPRNLENYGEYILINYEQPSSFVDIFERNGIFYRRIDVSEELFKLELQLLSIQQVIFPRMKWSDRKIEEFERMSKLSLMKKFIIIGTCQEEPQSNTEEIEFQTRRTSTITKTKSKHFLLVYDLHNSKTENFKILDFNDAQIEVINFGPFDNGYLLIGLSSGVLVAIDLHSMEIIINYQLFDCAIKAISFEPTNLVFVASKKKDLVAVSLVKKEMHYMYLELGRRQFSTIAVPNQNINSSYQDDDPCQGQSPDNPFRLCC